MKKAILEILFSVYHEIAFKSIQKNLKKASNIKILQSNETHAFKNPLCLYFQMKNGLLDENGG